MFISLVLCPIDPGKCMVTPGVGIHYTVVSTSTSLTVYLFGISLCKCVQEGEEHEASMPDALPQKEPPGKMIMVSCRANNSYTILWCDYRY